MSDPQELKDRIRNLADDEKWAEIAPMLSDQHPGDLADIIEDMPAELHEPLFSLIHEDVKPDVLAELEGRASTDVLASLTNDELADIVEEMAPDDAADVLQTVFTVLLENRAGELTGVAGELANAGVNLEATYVVGLAGDLIELAVAADDPKKAKKALE